MSRSWSLQRRPPKELTFKNEGKIRELARRGEAWQASEDRQMLAVAKRGGRTNGTETFVWEPGRTAGPCAPTSRRAGGMTSGGWCIHGELTSG